MTTHIFPIKELDVIICNYCDHIRDLSALAQVNTYYHKMMNNMSIYTELKELASKTIQRGLCSACYYNFQNAVAYFLKYEQNANIDGGFHVSCENGYLQLAYNLYYLCDDKNIHKYIKKSLPQICAESRLDIVFWLYNLVDEIDLFVLIEGDSDCMEIIIQREYFDAFIWLSNLESFKENAYWTIYFEHCVICQQLDMATYIYDNHSADIEPDDDDLFIACCDDLDSCIWLYNLNYHHSNMREIYDLAFVYSDSACRLEVVVWLYNLGINIDIRTNHDKFFMEICYMNNIVIAIWLVNICDNYGIIWDYCDTMIPHIRNY